MPIGVGTIADGDEGGAEDGSGRSEGKNCEVHLVLQWRARPDRPGERRSNKAFVISDIFRVDRIEILTQPSDTRANLRRVRPDELYRAVFQREADHSVRGSKPASVHKTCYVSE